MLSPIVGRLGAPQGVERRVKQSDMTITILGRVSLADVERVANLYMRVGAGRSGRGAT